MLSESLETLKAQKRPNVSSESLETLEDCFFFVVVVVVAAGVADALPLASAGVGG